MSTAITSENEQFVNQMIQAGSYSSREEVLNDALTLLRERDAVRRKVQAGIEQIERGETVPGDEVFARVRGQIDEIAATNRNAAS